MMQQVEGQTSVKDFLIAEYEGKLSKQESYECHKSIMDFVSTLSEVAEGQNLTHDRHNSTNDRTTPI